MTKAPPSKQPMPSRFVRQQPRPPPLLLLLLQWIRYGGRTSASDTEGCIGNNRPGGRHADSTAAV